MKVLYIVPSTNTSYGSTKSFLTLLDGLSRKGIEPHIVTPDRDDLYGVLQSRGYNVLSLRYRLSTYPDFATLRDKILFLPRLVARRIIERSAVRSIVDYCQRNDIQLIHTNVGLLTCGYTAARRLHLPHIFHIREYADIDFGYRHYPSRRVFYNRLNAPGNYTICITRGIQEYHRLQPPASRVIYNGIQTDLSPFTPHPSPLTSRYLLFAGRIEPSKGAMQVIEAFDACCQQITASDVQLKIAGDIENAAYYNQLQTYVAEHHLQNRVQFLGNRTDLAQLMQSALATIVASAFEGFGRCLPEAMLAGCLTIGRNTTGTKEQYDNGLSRCGQEIGLRYETTSQLANLMQQVIEAPADAFDSMKECARATVLQLYSTQTYVDSVYDFYQEILKSRS